MNEQLLELAQRGFDAWRRGEFEVIEAMLDPEVEWGWFEPGEWDCHNRDDVMRTLRERFDEGFARGELEFVPTGAEAIVVVAHPAAIGGPEWPEETATLIVFRDGRVISMRDYPTRA